MSGKAPGPGERGRTPAPKDQAITGVTTRSRSRGQLRPTPYPVHPPGTPTPRGAPCGPAFHPGGPPATSPRYSAVGSSPKGPSDKPQPPRGPPPGPAICPTRPQATQLPPIHPRGPQATPFPGGGVKRGPPRGSGSPSKRGPASPPPPSRGIAQSHATYSGGQPGTPSKEITRGLARCSIGQSTTSGSQPVTPSSGKVTQGPTTRTGGQLSTPSRGVTQHRYI